MSFMLTKSLLCTLGTRYINSARDQAKSKICERKVCMCAPWVWRATGLGFSSSIKTHSSSYLTAWMVLTTGEAEERGVADVLEPSKAGEELEAINWDVLTRTLLVTTVEKTKPICLCCLKSGCRGSRCCNYRFNSKLPPFFRSEVGGVRG